MNKLKEFIEHHDVFTRPVDVETIHNAECALNITFTPEYKCWLETAGVLSYESSEVFGLGVSDTAWLNILRATAELRSEFPLYPANAVPLMDAEDGQFYLYDHEVGNIVRWSSVAGVMERLKLPLEEFLLEQISL